MGLLPARTVIPLERRAHHARHAPWSGAARAEELAEEARLAPLDHVPERLTSRTRIEVAFILSMALHAFVVMTVTFSMPDKGLSDLSEPLQVVLVNAKSSKPPEKADALAQENLDGGGNTDAPRQAKSPFPVRKQEKREDKVVSAEHQVEKLERKARQLLTRQKRKTEPAPEVEAAPQTPQPVAPEAPPAPSASEIMQRGLEIARLEAQISKQWDSYQKRPRRRFIGARTKEFRFARYVEDWRSKIERVGELNYPQAARDQKVYGSLVVTVSIKANGALEKIEINRPSGWKILDEAALRIVKLAAPFAPFPADIARDTDILSITRTWTFTRSDQLVAE
jgi:protein TonB